MRRDTVVRAGAGLVVAAGLVLTSAAACDSGSGAQTPPSQAPAVTPPPQAPAPAPSQKPADGIPNNGDGDADG